MLQDYHNLRVTTFNRNVEELGKWTADMAESRSRSSSFFSSLRGRASAPAGCSPRDSGRLLSSRVESSLSISYCSSSSADFAAANASLRAQLGESQTAIRAKDAELAAFVQERDRLVSRPEFRDIISQKTAFVLTSPRITVS